MKIEQSELINVLTQFNPWWKEESIPDLPTWKRAAHRELYQWTVNPPAARAVMLSGARQVGKTTLLMQVIDDLLKEGVPSSNILYATFDHPLLKLAGPDEMLQAWRTREPKVDGKEYLFLDEAQFIRDWGTWIKHQVDFHKPRQIVFTGSALPLVKAGQESGVGRWHTIRVTTLSFYEYVQLKQLSLPQIPEIHSLKELYQWHPHQFMDISDKATHYIPHFHHYLLQGGFPQTAVVNSITQVQKLIREDIVDKVLKRDMTALFGVRRVLDLEHVFLYLCLHDGAILDILTLCKNLEVTRPTAQGFIDLLESTHLIYRLQPFGYGKEVLRGRSKLYISDQSIAPAVLLKGSSVLENPALLGTLVESSVLKHLYARYYSQNIKFSYWRPDDKLEVDLIAEVNNQIIPFEVKYQSDVDASKLKGLIQFCAEKTVSQGYVVTKLLSDFGPLPQHPRLLVPVLRIPATLLCYWMGQIEALGGEPFDL